MLKSLPFTFLNDGHWQLFVLLSDCNEGSWAELAVSLLHKLAKLL